jgi:acetyl-CoA carboxylase carboxyl transferase subunit alpha
MTRALTHVPDFEQPVQELEKKIQELKNLASQGDVSIADDIVRLQKKADKILEGLYSNLTPWQTVQVARHPDRPRFLDYLNALMTDFVPLAGDRVFGEDRALVGGLARLNGRSVVVMGHQKGHDTESRVYHHFGMPRPEGYRKAQRLMHLADRFGLPLVSFIDTAGAWPGVDAEERGQAEAIARCLEVALGLRVPVITVVIGEGGSGGAIAIGVANAVLMLEHAMYSVISPEGCASILWQTRDKAPDAAEAQKMTARDLKAFGMIDDIIAEPPGGAHRHPQETIHRTGTILQETLVRLETSVTRFQEHRMQKFMAHPLFGPTP